MGQILIRQLDDTVIDGLRRRARASGLTVEDEARRALAAAAEPDRVAAAQRLAEVRDLIDKLKGASTHERLCTGQTRTDR